MSKSKDNQKTRLTFLELVAFWEGKVNTTVLTRQFGISRQQASTDFRDYNQVSPDNLDYNPSAKAYLARSPFTPQLIATDVGQYLNWLISGTLVTAQPAIPCDALQLPPRQVSPEVMRGLVSAIRGQQRIEVDYVSLSNPNREGRVVAPHSFVKTGLRWHLRAWCEKSQSYRDFVLSRFRGVPEPMGKTDHPAWEDESWNTSVTLVFQPDPRLSPEKRQVLEEDYQMQKGQLSITTRACLVQYLLNEMQVNTKVLDGTPEAQQLVLVNKNDIKRWLFEG